MPAGCQVAPQWKSLMMLLPLQFEYACEVGMEDAMNLVTNIARRSARWNPDGTDTGKWLVTGTARESITGYLAGRTPISPLFNVTDPIYQSVHRSPEGSGANYLASTPGHVIGVLTMTEHHADVLQDYEIRGTRSGLSRLTAGDPITEQAIRDNEQLIWNAIDGTIRALI